MLRAHAGFGETELRHVDLDALLPPGNPQLPLPLPEWAVDDRLPRLRYSDLKLVRLIGQGGIGRVYRANERRTGKTFAVKFIKKQFWKHALAMESLATELDALSRIDHRGVVRSLGWGRTPSGTPFIASELIEGQTLHEWSQSDQPTVPRKLARLADAAEVLAAVHAAGLVHGDVTPTNILCEHSSGRVVLVDFGLATNTHVSPATRTGATLAFAAPEQVSPGFGPVGPWTDLYGLGATAFTILTGGALHEGLARPEIIAHILDGAQATIKSKLEPLLRPEMVTLLVSCVSTNRHHRPASIATLAHILRSP
jgi:serine/threonine protein kinase